MSKREIAERKKQGSLADGTGKWWRRRTAAREVRPTSKMGYQDTSVLRVVVAARRRQRRWRRNDNDDDDGRMTARVCGGDGSSMAHGEKRGEHQHDGDMGDAQGQTRWPEDDRSDETTVAGGEKEG